MFPLMATTHKLWLFLVLIQISSFCVSAQFVTQRTTVLLDGSEEGRGESYFTATGGVAPYEFVWTDGFSGAERLGMLPGLYNVTASDAADNEVRHFFPVGYKIFWTNLVSLDATIKVNSDNTLEEGPSATTGFNKGASSENKLAIARDGWVGFVCESTATNWYAIGLSDSPADQTLTSIDYAIVNRYGVLEVYRSNGVRVYRDDVTLLQPGEFLRLERKSGVVSAYRNATLIWEFETQTSQELAVDVSLADGKMPVVTSSFARPESNVPPEYKPDQNYDKNWSFTMTYDEQGNVLSQTKVFYDLIGRPVQGQFSDLSSDNVFAAQILYDAMGRRTATTLAAPIDNAAFNYQPDFMTDNAGNVYTHENFDGPKLNNPDPVSNDQAGTLGYYFSSRNSMEPNTPITSFPYSRVEYDDQPSGGVKRSSRPGDQFRMGSGHEIKGMDVPILSELDHYVSLRSHFLSNNITSLAFEGHKMIRSDQNGNEEVSFIDRSGQMLASCLSGPAFDAVSVTAVLDESPTCFQAVQFIRLPGDEGSISISCDYIEAYDVGDNNRLIFKGTPDAGFVDLLPDNTVIELRSNDSFYVLFFTDIFSFRRIASSEIPTANIVHRKNYLDLHVSIGQESPITISGSGNAIKVFNRMTNQLIYDGPASGLTVMSPGIYRIVTQLGTGIYNINYNVHYGSFTYHYYDDAGRMIATVSPKGVSPESVAYPFFTSTTTFDASNRVITTSTSDQGVSEFVYRTDGTLRFSQNAQQKADGKFSYTNFDRLGRMVQTGEYVMQTDETGTVFQDHLESVIKPNSVLQPSVLENKDRNGGLDPAHCVEISEVWYDLPFSDSQIAGRNQAFVFGKVSKTKNEHVTTWYSYDDRGRIVWTVQDIAGLGIKVVEYEYDLTGNVAEVAYQKDVANEAFYHHYLYDASQRLKEVYTSRDGISKKLQATYHYYLHGPLKRVELEDNLQGIDYVYTIDGSLKSINHADKAIDPGNDGNDVFGLTLQYHQNDYQGANYSAGDFVVNDFQNQYNGLLKAVNWHSAANLNTVGTYGFDYDHKYQLKDARFGGLTNGTSYGFEPDPYNDFNEKITVYDDNGNIRRLSRSGLHLGETSNPIADFTYEYSPNTNRLSHIDQGGSQIIGFDYNLSGQTISRTENNATVTYIYNAHGLMSEVTDGENPLVSYYYDEQGNRLRMRNYTDGVPEKDTWYVRDAGGTLIALYEQALPSLLVTLSEMSVYGAGRIAVYKPESNTFFYEIDDHLGNVRAVIGKPDAEVVAATFENNSYLDETNDFPNSYSRVVADLYDHTDGGKVYTYAHLLNGGYDGRIGMAKSFDVMPGDKFRAEVYAKYEGIQGANSDISGFATALAYAFGLTPTGTGEMAKAYQAINAHGLCVEIGDCNPDDDPSADPRGYLTVLVFDRNYNLVESAADKIDPLYAQSGGKKKPFDLLSLEFDIKEPGYAYVFLSNEGNVHQNIYFDDLEITHTYSPIVAGADYYPFGMPMQGREINREPYRYGYQGLFSEKDDATELNVFELRSYDSRIARWLTRDVFGQHPSPYLAMGNNPVSRVDIDGGTDFVNKFGVVIGTDGVDNGKSFLVWKRRDLKLLRSRIYPNDKTQINELSPDILELPNAAERAQLQELWGLGEGYDNREFSMISLNGLNGAPGTGLIRGEGPIWTGQGNGHVDPVRDAPVAFSAYGARFDMSHARIVAHTHNIDFKKYSTNATTGEYKTGQNKPSPNDYELGRAYKTEINLVLQNRTDKVALLNNVSNRFISMSAKYFFLNFRNNAMPLVPPARRVPRYIPSGL